MQPILPSIDDSIDKAPVSLYVVNDTYRDFKGAQYCWTLGTAERNCEPGHVRPDSVAKVIELAPLPQIASGTKKLDVWIEAAGENLGHNSLSLPTASCSDGPMR